MPNQGTLSIEVCEILFCLHDFVVDFPAVTSVSLLVQQKPRGRFRLCCGTMGYLCVVCFLPVNVTLHYIIFFILLVYNKMLLFSLSHVLMTNCSFAINCWAVTGHRTVVRSSSKLHPQFTRKCWAVTDQNC